MKGLAPMVPEALVMRVRRNLRFHQIADGMRPHIQEFAALDDLGDLLLEDVADVPPLSRRREAETS